MNTAPRLAAGFAAALFLAFHLPFLAPSLEDLDSINFALGVRDFDVARHQPHPPGYPLYIAAAKVLGVVVKPEARLLSVLSVLGGALAVLALVALFRSLDPDGEGSSPFTWIAVAVVAANPLFWVTAARPLSDMPGFAAAIAVQAWLIRVRTPAALAIAAAAASFAAGIRSQVVWLTVPLMFVALGRLPRRDRLKAMLWATGSYAVGGLLWFVPLVIISGGPQAYWRALFNQGAEDLTGVAMLATTPTLRQLFTAVQYTFLFPWGYWQAGLVVLVSASAGLLAMYKQSKPALLVLLAGFGPYLIFDLLFQETVTARYALPLVVPIGYLAIRGLSLLPRDAAVAAGVALAGYCVFVDDTSLASYSQMEAPAFRMLGDMAGERRGDTAAVAPVLAMHRREEMDLRRSIQWVAERLPPMGEHLPAPPKHEWLQLVSYWDRGGRQPIWFVADPLRSDLALVGGVRHPVQYRWPMTLPALIGGVRPNEMDWHRIDAPDWYLAEGWALTPETAGIAREDGRGPGYGPIAGRIRRWKQSTNLVIGGRNLTTAGTPARLRVAIDRQVIEDISVAPGFFLRLLTVPALAGDGDYATITVESDNRDLAIEQFNAQPAGRVVSGFGDNWNEQEYNPSTGVLWRWTRDKSTIHVRPEGHALALTLRGEIEAGSSSHVTIRAGDRVAAEFDVGRSFGRTVIIPAALLGATETTVSIESSASYVPAERRWRSKDRRRLGLKLYECAVTAAS